MPDDAGRAALGTRKRDQRRARVVTSADVLRAQVQELRERRMQLLGNLRCLRGDYIELNAQAADVAEQLASKRLSNHLLRSENERMRRELLLAQSSAPRMMPSRCRQNTGVRPLPARQHVQPSPGVHLQRAASSGSLRQGPSYINPAPHPTPTTPSSQLAYQPVSQLRGAPPVAGGGSHFADAPSCDTWMLVRTSSSSQGFPGAQSSIIQPHLCSVIPSQQCAVVHCRNCGGCGPAATLQGVRQLLEQPQPHDFGQGLSSVQRPSPAQPRFAGPAAKSSTGQLHIGLAATLNLPVQERAASGAGAHGRLVTTFSQLPDHGMPADMTAAQPQQDVYGGQVQRQTALVHPAARQLSGATPGNALPGPTFSSACRTVMNSSPAARADGLTCGNHAGGGILSHACSSTAQPPYPPQQQQLGSSSSQGASAAASPGGKVQMVEPASSPQSGLAGFGPTVCGEGVDLTPEFIQQLLDETASDGGGELGAWQLEGSDVQDQALGAAPGAPVGTSHSPSAANYNTHQPPAANCSSHPASAANYSSHQPPAANYSSHTPSAAIYSSHQPAGTLQTAGVGHPQSSADPGAASYSPHQPTGITAGASHPQAGADPVAASYSTHQPAGTLQRAGAGHPQSSAEPAAGIALLRSAALACFDGDLLSTCAKLLERVSSHDGN